LGTADVVDQVAAVPPAQSPYDHTWRRNLAIVWVASLLGAGAQTFTNPFMPLFLSMELGMTNPGEIAAWTGTIAFAMGASLFFFSPVWGAVADRYGRKLMLMRALAGGGLFTALLSVSGQAWHAALFRFGFGTVTGIMPTSSAMIAAQTPRAHVGWALGMLASAFAIGQAFGPLAAGLAAPVIGLRAVFLISGGVLLVATVVVGVAMHETKRVVPRDHPSVLTQLRTLDSRNRREILVLLGVQAFLTMATQSSNPMVAVKILHVAGRDAAAATGLAFTLFGIATALAAIFYSRPIRWIGYRGVVYAAMSAIVLCVIVLATSSTVAVIVATMGVFGFASGSMQPAIRSILGLASPTALAGTMFGLNNSATAVGLGFGPFLAGVIAATFDVSWAIAFALVPLIIASVTFRSVREPAV
jgi:DHA1 family multidrug resistance protein-like MFS transporter